MHVTLEALEITLDPIDAIHCAELFRHLPYNPKDADLTAGGLVFDRLSDGKPE